MNIIPSLQLKTTYNHFFYLFWYYSPSLDQINQNFVFQNPLKCLLFFIISFYFSRTISSASSVFQVHYNCSLAFATEDRPSCFWFNCWDLYSILFFYFKNLTSSFSFQRKNKRIRIMYKFFLTSKIPWKWNKSSKNILIIIQNN